MDECATLFAESFKIEEEVNWPQKKYLVQVGISKEGLGDFLTLSLNAAEIWKNVLAVTIDNLKELVRGESTLE